MTDLLRNVSVIDGPLAEQMSSGEDLSPTERGDNVIVFSFGGSEADSFLHLSRGMEREDVANGLEAAAKAIREETA